MVPIAVAYDIDELAVKGVFDELGSVRDSLPHIPTRVHHCLDLLHIPAYLVLLAAV